MLNWENTDQFGNLKVAESAATSLDNVESDLRDMVRAVFDEHDHNVTFAVDAGYAEISAPRGDQVSHILNLPFVNSAADKHAVQHALIEKLREIVGEDAKVQGPWD